MFFKKSLLLYVCIFFLIIANGFGQGLTETVIDTAKYEPEAISPTHEKTVDPWLRNEQGTTSSYPRGMTQWGGQASNVIFRLTEGNRKGRFDKVDQVNPYSSGLNIANLTPEGIDLNIFPSFKISSELTLKPSLSYGPDSIMERAGLVNYAPPKKWQTHYGEMVFLLPRTDHILDNMYVWNGGPLSLETDHMVSSAVQVYFVNATGEEVDFYPSKDFFNTINEAIYGESSPESPRVWFSNQSQYRLEQVPTLDDFIIYSPQGLKFYLQRYKIERDTPTPLDFSYTDNLEYLSLHFRVYMVEDRYGNKINITFEDPDTNRPTVAQAQDNLDNNGVKINYFYDDLNRLTSIVVPRVTTTDTTTINHDMTSTFTFKYAKDITTVDDALAFSSASGIVSAPNEPLELTPLTPTNQPTVYIPNLSEFNDPDDCEAINKITVYMDLSKLDFSLSSYIDFEDPLFRQQGFLFKINGFYFKINAWQFATSLQNGVDDVLSMTPNAINYKYQLDSYRFRPPYFTTYPFLPDDTMEVGPQYMDSVELVLVHMAGHSTSGTLDEEETYNVDILPVIKPGDEIYSFSGGSLNKDKDITWEDCLGATAHRPMLDLTCNSVGTKYIIRKDNQTRIASIEFPVNKDEYPKQQKIMKIVYDDLSNNHQEIKSVEIQHRNIPEAGPHSTQVVSRTEYTYEKIKTVQVLDRLGEDPNENKDIDYYAFRDTTSPCSFRGNLDHYQQGSAIQQVGWGLNTVETEKDILRKKASYYYDIEGNLLPVQSTYFGGGYHFVFAGQPGGSLFGDDNEPLCSNLQWCIDGRPFDYTWIINPDETATVFDLNPRGTALPQPFIAGNKRSRVFKTYSFDNNFKSSLMSSLEITNMEEYPHFFEFIPTRTKYPRRNIDGHPIIDMTDLPNLSDVWDPKPFEYNDPVEGDVTFFEIPYETLALEEMFSPSTFGSKCFKTDVTIFEPVPIFSYNMNDQYIRRLTVRSSMAYTGIDTYTIDTTNHIDFYFARLSAVDAITRYFNGGFFGSIHCDEPFNERYKKLPVEQKKERMFDEVQKYFSGDLVIPLYHELGTCDDGLPFLTPALQFVLPSGNLGYFQTTTPTTPTTPTGDEVTAYWPLGGNDGFGNKLRPYYDLQSLSNLKPSMTYQAINYDGFGWDIQKNIVQITPANISSGKSFSSGGYLGRINDGGFDPNLRNQITMAELPPNIRLGDFVVTYGRIYEITDKTTTSITVEPEIQTATSSSDCYFYRLFNRNHSPYQTGSGASYLGYDDLGNNSLQIDFSNHPDTPLIFEFPDDDYGSLIPGFSSQNVTSFQLTDQTNPVNSEISKMPDGINFQEWRFRGKTTYQYISSSNPFYYEDNNSISFTETTPINFGQVQSWGYDVNRPWLVSKEINIFPIMFNDVIPLDVSKYASRNIDNSISWNTFMDEISVHIDTNINSDLNSVTEYTYEGSTEGFKSGNLHFKAMYLNSNTMNRTTETYTYSDLGQLLTQETSFEKENMNSLKSWVDFDPDPNTGLVRSQTMSVESETTGGGFIRLPVTMTESLFDYLQRNIETKQYHFDEEDEPFLFGQRVLSDYVSPFLKETRVLNTQGLQLLKKLEYFNGMGKPTYSFYQNGFISKVYGTAQTYDVFGRPGRSYSEQLIGSTFPNALENASFFYAREHDSVENIYNYTSNFGAFSKSYFNERGESYGVEIFDISENSVSETWTHNKWIDGHQETYSITRHGPIDGTNTKDLVKKQVFDSFGNLIHVEDHELAEDSYDRNDDILEIATPGVTIRSHVDYEFDRFGNVISAKVTDIEAVSNPQTRNFQFDQKSRLREERHPELGSMGKVVYYNFDLFDNPGTIHEFGEGGPVKTTKNTFDASGNLLKSERGSFQFPQSFPYRIDYVYQYQTGLTELNRFPNLLTAVRVLDESSNPYAIAYGYEYDGSTGLLLSREMRHTFGEHLPGHEGSQNSILDQDPVDLFTGDGLPIEETLKTQYDYMRVGDDIILDRLTSITYPYSLEQSKRPTPINNTSNILRFHYHSGTQLLTQIEDESYGIAVIDNIQYGPGGQVTSYRLPNGKSVVKSYDSLNRLNNLNFSLYPEISSNHAYSYDSVGRINEIINAHSNGQSQKSSFTYDAVGQLVGATIGVNLEEAESSIEEYNYSYDPFGNLAEMNDFPPFGNMTSQNRLTETDSLYSPFGELTQVNLSTTIGMGYNLAGRLIEETHNEPEFGVVSEFHYDPFGMRVFVRKTKDPTNGDPDVVEDRLYVYDENNMVLNEITSVDTETKWDKTYIYFEGKTAVTYEGASHTPEPVTMGVPTLRTQGPIIEAKIEWENVFNGFAYDIEVADSSGNVVKTYFGVKTTLQSLLRFHSAHYQYRVREQHGPWSPWQSIEILDEEALTTVGFYKMESNGQDSSIELNHAVVSGATPVEAVTDQGYQMGGNDYLTVTNPINFPSGSGEPCSISAWIKPTQGEISNNQILFQLIGVGDLERMEFQLKADGRFNVLIGKQLINVDSGPILHYNQWNYVSFVFDNNTLNIYLNAENAFQLIQSNPFEMYSTQFIMGASISGYEGVMDEVMVQNVAIDIVNHQARFFKDLPPECVLHFDFNNDTSKSVLDSSTYLNHGGKTGVALTVGQDGTAQSAYYFAGTKNVITGGTRGFPDGKEPFTISAWVKPNGYPSTNFNSIASLGTSDCGPGALLALQNTGKVSGTYSCQQTFQVLGEGLLLNQWQHVVMVFDGINLQFFCDAEMIHSFNVTPELLDVNRFLIGAGFNLEGSIFYGVLDEIRVYRGALSPDEILNLSGN